MEQSTMMSKLIRKISIGKDYKNDAMHYAVWQEVYEGNTICDMIEAVSYTCLPRVTKETELFAY